MIAGFYGFRIRPPSFDRTMYSPERTMNPRSFLATFLVALLTAACASTGEREVPASTSAPASPSPSTPATSLVGEWRRTNSCPMLVRALDAAGLSDVAPESLVRAWFFSREDEIDPAHPCRRAFNKPIYIFFTADGRLGAIDEDDVLVESETYEARDGDSFTIRADVDLATDSVSVNYGITGNTIRFDVVVPHRCGPTCRVIRSWAFAVFRSGTFVRRP
jgi:hypothetical protein